MNATASTRAEMRERPSTQEVGRIELKTRWTANLWNARGKILAYGLVLAAVAVGLKSVFIDPSMVMLATVERREVVAEVLGTGIVTTNVAPKVGSKINGRVAEVLVDEGDVVEPGQLIALLEDDDLRHQVERAAARLEAARASAQQATSAWERAKRLVQAVSISREEYEVYEEKSRVARSQVGVEEAELRYREFKLTEARVFAAVGGLVIKRWVDPGDAVVIGQPLVTVADTSLIWVAANVDQRFVGKVRKGQPATVILRGRTAKPFEGKVARINPQADPVAEEMLVEVSFPLPVEELQVGQWAEVFIEVDTSRDALVIPKAAVMPMGDDRFVFAADAEGKVRRVQVEPGATSPRLADVAVTGELEAGDQGVLRPMGLKEGDSVRASGAVTGGSMGR